MIFTAETQQKFEARNTKYETISNDKMSNVQNSKTMEMNHPAASSGVSQSSFPRRRESRHGELDTRFRGYDKRSKLQGI